MVTNVKYYSFDKLTSLIIGKCADVMKEEDTILGRALNYKIK